MKKQTYTYVLCISLGCLSVFVYLDILCDLFSGVPTVLSPQTEIAVSTLAFMGFSILHATYVMGPLRAIAFCAASSVISWLFEQVGVETGLVYGHYHYTDSLGIKLGHVPLLIPVAWFMMIWPCFCVAFTMMFSRLPYPREFLRMKLVPCLGVALLGSITMTCWDLSIDPMLAFGPNRAWVWEQGGPYFGIPAQNFLGWGITTFCVYCAFMAIDRVLPPADSPTLVRPVACLPLLAYGLMIVSLCAGNDRFPAVKVIAPLSMGLPLTMSVLKIFGVC